MANVEAGRVDPLLYEYLRGARSRFQAGRGAAGRRAVRRSGRRCAGLGPRLSEHGPRREPRRDRRANRPGRRGQRRRTQRDVSRRRRAGPATARRTGKPAAGAEQRRAEVCVDVAAGRETAVSLRRSSGNAALDRLTRGVVHEGDRGAPRSADARRGLACYELRISAFRMPPLPFISCGFDIASRPDLRVAVQEGDLREGPVAQRRLPAADGAAQRAGEPVAAAQAPLIGAHMVGGVGGTPTVPHRRRARCAENSKACY